MVKGDRMNEDIDYVKRSKNRTNVMKSLNEFPKIPSELADATGISRQHISHALRELSERDLVVCLNPEYARGRIYRLTEKGKETLKKIS